MIFFPYIGNVMIPTDELIFFIGVGLNHQPVIVGVVRFMINIWPRNGDGSRLGLPVEIENGLQSQ